MASNVWLIGNEVAIDTESLLSANAHCNRSCESWQSAVEDATAALAQLSSCWALAASPTVAALLSEAIDATESALARSAQVLEESLEFTAWRERAVQLYEHAEDNVDRLARACELSHQALCSRALGSWRTFGSAPTYTATGLFFGRQVSGFGIGGSQTAAYFFSLLLNPVNAPWFRLQSVAVVGRKGRKIVGPAIHDLDNKATVKALPAAPPSRKVPTPRTAEEAILALKEDSPSSAQDHGQVRIMEHTSSTGTKSWTVLINGTKTWGVHGPNPQDLETNLQELSGISSAQQLAVTSAMALAGIKSTEPVELVCHSQGGLVGQGIAANTAGRFKIVSVLTAGSPVRSATVPHPRTLALVDIEDAVPGLNRPQQTLTAYGQNDNGSSAHSLENYAELAKNAEQEPDGKQWADVRSLEMNLSRYTETVVHTFNTERIR